MDDDKSLDDDDDDDDDDDESSSDDDEQDLPKEGETWETVGTGWTNIINFIKNNNELKQIFDSINWSDVRNYIGKNYEHYLARGYLKRMNYHQKNFRIKWHKIEKYVFKIENMKSKYKSANKYTIVLSFKQIELYLRSITKYIAPNDNSTIGRDEMHWYNSIRNKAPVSNYLSDKYRKVMEMLNQQRIKRMDERRKFYWGHWNVGVMKKLELELLAHENNIKYDKKKVKTKKQLKNYLIKELRKQQKDNNTKNNNNNNDNNNPKKQKKKIIIAQFMTLKKYTVHIVILKESLLEDVVYVNLFIIVQRIVKKMIGMRNMKKIVKI